MFAHFLNYFSHGDFKNIYILLKNYKPWTKSASYNVNHNIIIFLFEEKST